MDSIDSYDRNVVKPIDASLPREPKSRPVWIMAVNKALLASGVIKLILCMVAATLSALQLQMDDSSATVAKRNLHRLSIVTSFLSLLSFMSVEGTVFPWPWQASLVFFNTLLTLLVCGACYIADVVTTANYVAVGATGELPVTKRVIFLSAASFYTLVVTTVTLAALATDSVDYQGAVFVITSTFILSLGLYVTCMLWRLRSRLWALQEHLPDGSTTEARRQLLRLIIVIGCMVILCFAVSLAVGSEGLGDEEERSYSGRQAKRRRQYDLASDLASYVAIATNYVIIYYAWVPLSADRRGAVRLPDNDGGDNGVDMTGLLPSDDEQNDAFYEFDLKTSPLGPPEIEARGDVGFG